MENFLPILAEKGGKIQKILTPNKKILNQPFFVQKQPKSNAIFEAKVVVFGDFTSFLL